MSINFIKMHGLGNDFIMIDKSNLPKISDMQKFVLKIANYHLGIGCDQCIFFEHINDTLYCMEIYNKDGSKATACGNAVRCLANFIYHSDGSQNIVITVNKRLIHCSIVENDKISVNMGPAIFQSSWMPKLQDIWNLVTPYQINHKEVICVDVGNEHLVLFSQQLCEKDRRLLGSKISSNNIFPSGVNVNFASIIDQTINLNVWERGTGFTLACGSGACASFAAANKLGFVGNNAKVRFSTGLLEMAKIREEIIMTGPATIVAKGVYYDR